MQASGDEASAAARPRLRQRRDGASAADISEEQIAELVATEDREAVAQANEAKVKSRRALGQKSSRFTGVTWDKQNRYWKAQLGSRLTGSGSCQFVGHSTDEAEAARMYDEAVRALGRGEAHDLLNFPTAEDLACMSEGDNEERGEPGASSEQADEDDVDSEDSDSDADEQPGTVSAAAFLWPCSH